MSYDPSLMLRQRRRWQNAKHLSLPRHPAHPVVWVDEQDRMRLFHPAVSTWQHALSPPFAWDDLMFTKAVGELRARAGEMIAQKLEQQGVPQSFYGSFIDAVQAEAVQMPQGVNS